MFCCFFVFWGFLHLFCGVILREKLMLYQPPLLLKHIKPVASKSSPGREHAQKAGKSLSTDREEMIVALHL